MSQWSDTPPAIRISGWDVAEGIYTRHICGLELTLTLVPVDLGEFGWRALIRDRASNTEDSRTFFESPGGDEGNLRRAAGWAENIAVAWDDVQESADAPG